MPPAVSAEPPPPRRALLADVAWVLLAAALLMAPAAVWGRPFVFGDSVYYWGWGGDILDALVRPWPHASQAWVHGRTLHGWGFATHDATPADLRFNLTWLTARSAFYAVPFRVLFNLGGAWLVAAVQALISAAVLKIAIRAIAPAASWRAGLAVVAALAAATSLGFETGYLMPDLFGGLAVLAAAVLVVFPDRLSRAAKAGMIAAVAYAVVAHAENGLNIAVAVALTALVNVGLGWRTAAARAAPLALALVVGLMLAAAGSSVLSYAFGRAVHMAPFPESRLLADGAAQAYLRKTCAATKLQACDLADPPPAAIEYYLWTYPLERPVSGQGEAAAAPTLAQYDRLMHRHVTDAEADRRERFVAEQPSLVLGALKTDGVREGEQGLLGGFLGVMNFGVGADFDSAALFAKGGQTILKAQMDGLFPGGAEGGRYPLDLTAPIQYAAVLASLIFLGLSAARRSGPDEAALSRLLVFVMAMAIANAVLCGVISGPYSRYQARVEWLIPFAALAMLARGRAFAGLRPPQPALSAERPGSSAPL
jgi:hypothetical protein